MARIFALAGHASSDASISHLLSAEDHPEFTECSDAVLENFLDGLIIDRRGSRPNVQADNPGPAPPRLTNNMILKKVRIALELREEHILDIMKAADFPLSKAELGGLLRKPGTRQYKPCGEQLLRNFLFGLGKIRRNRGPVAPPTE